MLFRRHTSVFIAHICESEVNLAFVPLSNQMRLKSRPNTVHGHVIRYLPTYLHIKILRLTPLRQLTCFAVCDHKQEKSVFFQYGTNTSRYIFALSDQNVSKMQ